MKVIQDAIRGIPADVDPALRQKARHRRVSLNQVVVEEPAKANGEYVRRRDLSAFAGKWQLDAEFDHIIAEGRQINPEMWK